MRLLAGCRRGDAAALTEGDSIADLRDGRPVSPHWLMVCVPAAVPPRPFPLLPVCHHLPSRRLSPVPEKDLQRATAKGTATATLPAPDACCTALVAAAWPGNVRQLENYTNRHGRAVSSRDPRSLIQKQPRRQCRPLVSFDSAAYRVFQSFEDFFATTTWCASSASLPAMPRRPAQMAGRNRTEFYKLYNATTWNRECSGPGGRLVHPSPLHICKISVQRYCAMLRAICQPARNPPARRDSDLRACVDTPISLAPGPPF